MNSADQLAELAQAIRDRRVMSPARLTLAQFRDLHHKLQGIDSSERQAWCIVLLNDEALIQAAGTPDATIHLYDQRGRWYTQGDFDFIPVQDRQIVGSIAGRYRFREFLKELGPTATIVAVLASIVLTLLFAEAVPITFVAALNNALVGALAIFVSIFVLFVLSVDPDKEYRYLRSGTFHKLAQSDKYIAAIGLAALTLAISANALSAVAAQRPVVHMLMAAASATAASLTGASFWLVITYHLVRKHEMAAYQMAVRFLKEANPREP